jgi:hypothetical protein
MSVFSPVTWAMSAVQLVSTTTSQLATLNSIQAAFVASTYWEVETSGLSSLSYKYIVVRPKAALGSIYADYRIFFCERVNFATGRVTGDGGAKFNTTTNVMAYFCPDGGALTFTAANIETGLLWPGTNYKTGTSTIWHGVTVACTALWLYEGDGVMWLVSRQSATSHSLMALGNVMCIAKNTYADYGSSSPTTEIGCPSFYTATTLGNASNLVSQLWTGTRAQAFWYKPNGVAARTCQPFNGTNISNTGLSYTSSLQNSTSYDAAVGTAPFVPVLVYGVAAAAGTIALRGVYYAGHFKTRTTIQSAAVTIGYTFYSDDSLQTFHGLAFMNS